MQTRISPSHTLFFFCHAGLTVSSFSPADYCPSVVFDAPRIPSFSQTHRSEHGIPVRGEAHHGLARPAAPVLSAAALPHRGRRGRRPHSEHHSEPHGRRGRPLHPTRKYRPEGEEQKHDAHVNDRSQMDSARLLSLCSPQTTTNTHLLL